MVRRRSGLARWPVLVVLTLAASGPLGAQDREPAAGNAEPAAEARAEDTVECLLPAGIDRLGSQLTKVAPRRTIETTVEDCAEREGEVVERPR